LCKFIAFFSPKFSGNNARIIQTDPCSSNAYFPVLITHKEAGEVFIHILAI